MNQSASKGQTFAIFCALKADVRACSLSYADADALIKLANTDKPSAMAKVQTMEGAIVKMPQAKAAQAPSAPKTGERKRSFASIWKEAKAQGLKAGNEARCVPMLIPGYAPIQGGVCGFASLDWDKRSAFAKWAKKHGIGDYHFIGEHHQSLAMKEAHAYAMADVLSKHGIKVRASSRID